MAEKPPLDPVALMRLAVAAWNQVAPPQAPAVEPDSPTARMMAQALAAANMPSRDDVGEIADRLDRIEQALSRIEAKIDSKRPRKKPTRKP